MIKDSSPCDVSRRQFCAVGASTLAATAFAGRLPVRAEPPAGRKELFHLNYIVAAPMYGTTPLATVLEEVKRTGADTIDIWPRPHANHREQMDALGFDEVERLLKDHGVRIGAITRYDLGPYRLVEEVQTLQRFHGKLLVCGAAPQKGDTPKDKIRNFVSSMTQHVEQAGEHGITVGIENHSKTILHTPDSIRYFAEFITAPNFGLAMAPYHLPQDAELIAGLIEELGDKLVLFQAWEHGKGCIEKLPKEQEMMQLPGRGTLDFTLPLAALKKIKYRGWTEIFMHPVPRGIPIRETPEEVTAEIKKSRDYLERCIARVP